MVGKRVQFNDESFERSSLLHVRGAAPFSNSPTRLLKIPEKVWSAGRANGFLALVARGRSVANAGRSLFVSPRPQLRPSRRDRWRFGRHSRPSRAAGMRWLRLRRRKRWRTHSPLLRRQLNARSAGRRTCRQSTFAASGMRGKSGVIRSVKIGRGDLGADRLPATSPRGSRVNPCLFDGCH
jgi:hypothetical protein